MMIKYTELALRIRDDAKNNMYILNETLRMKERSGVKKTIILIVRR